jgi:hypothetical protein
MLLALYTSPMSGAADTWSKRTPGFRVRRLLTFQESWRIPTAAGCVPDVVAVAVGQVGRHRIVVVDAVVAVVAVTRSCSLDLDAELQVVVAERLGVSGRSTPDASWRPRSA